MNRYRLVRIYRPSQEIVCSECRHALRVGDYHLEPCLATRRPSGAASVASRLPSAQVTELPRSSLSSSDRRPQGAGRRQRQRQPADR